MFFIVVGVLLLVAKLAGIGPPAEWSWWLVLSPFLAAALWWQFSDSMGLTQKRAMQRMEDRKQARREKAMDALGLPNAKARAAASREKVRAASGRPKDSVAEPPPPAPPRRDPRL
jgi:small Trp-rich protein